MAKQKYHMLHISRILSIVYGHVHVFTQTLKVMALISV
jgi:hypothetical protein